MISNRCQRQAPRRWPTKLAAIMLAAAAIAGAAASSPASAVPTGSTAATATTAWKDGHFAVDTSGVVGESDVVLGRPNPAPSQSLPLGNGNRPGNVQYSRPSYLLCAGIPLAAGKTVASVELPNVGPVPVQRTAELHVFSMAIG